MGSKSAMLRNGLGSLLSARVGASRRFVDLFTGSGAVAHFVAERMRIPVLAVDLQTYAVSLAGAVILRDGPVDTSDMWVRWHGRARESLLARRLGKLAALPVPALRLFSRQFVREMRSLAQTSELPLTRSYGGHYFSIGQSLWLDSLRLTVPRDYRHRALALGALIEAASRCVASPGHTAQPFQPTSTARPFLHEAWSLDILCLVRDRLASLGARHALRPGIALACDSSDVAAYLKPTDIVFIDPPYSAVHYSRFYHVLETIARGSCSSVTGTGRYPPYCERPRSSYSLVTESEEVISELLANIAEVGAQAIITFPNKKCSNGLSGSRIATIAAEEFDTVERYVVKGRFSTLGGNGYRRDARQGASEQVLLLNRR